MARCTRSGRVGAAQAVRGHGTDGRKSSMFRKSADTDGRRSQQFVMVLTHLDVQPDKSDPKR